MFELTFKIELWHIVIYHCIGTLLAYGYLALQFSEARDRWLLHKTSFRNYFEFRWMDSIIMFGTFLFWPIFLVLFLSFLIQIMRDDGDLDFLDHPIFNLTFHDEE